MMRMKQLVDKCNIEQQVQQLWMSATVDCANMQQLRMNVLRRECNSWGEK
jgi:hypothetical protein